MDLHPWSPEIRADPHTFWNDLREHDPVHRALGPVTGRAFWFVTRYEDCVAVLRHPALGKEYEKHLDPEQIAAQPDDQGPFRVLGRSMLFLDPPDHTRLRALVRPAFGTRAMSRLEAHVEEIARGLVDQLEGTVDLIDAVAYPLPVTVIAELLGIPEADRDRFRGWTAAVLGRTSADPDAAMADAMAAGLAFVEYLTDLAATRRSDPQDDLISHLLHQEEDPLSHQEFLAMVFLLLVAGHETTVNLIGNGTVELLRHPDVRRRLVEDPALVPQAVEEMLRFHGPVETATIRWAFEDVVIGGTIIPKGDLVVPVLFGANRDPAVFDDPDVFEPAREPNRHIAFGSGIHHCLGAPLARMEGRIAHRLLLERAPRMEPAVDLDELEWTPDFFLRGVRSLPVTVR